MSIFKRSKGSPAERDETTEAVETAEGPADAQDGDEAGDEAGGESGGEHGDAAHEDSPNR